MIVHGALVDTVGSATTQMNDVPSLVGNYMRFAILFILVILIHLIYQTEEQVVGDLEKKDKSA